MLLMHINMLLMHKHVTHQVAAHPTSVAALSNLANLHYLANRNIDLAEKLFKRALLVSPADGTLLISSRPHTLVA